MLLPSTRHATTEYRACYNLAAEDTNGPWHTLANTSSSLQCKVAQQSPCHHVSAMQTFVYSLSAFVLLCWSCSVSCHLRILQAVRHGALQLTAALSMVLQQHQYMSQMSPSSPMYGSNSLASASSMFHMSQSSGSPDFSYPYSHWYWPQAPSSPQGAPRGMPFMQAQYAASNTFSSGIVTSKGTLSGICERWHMFQLLTKANCLHVLR